MTYRPTILLDCDGVLADFCDAYLGLVAKLTGYVYPKEHITHFKIEECAWFHDLAWKHPGLKREVYEGIAQKGFCRNMSAMSGAKNGLDELRRLPIEILCVTSPWESSEYWLRERRDWLVYDMGFKPEEIIFAQKKQFTRGDMLVDDALHNIQAWPKDPTNSIPVLWDAPYNQGSTGGAPRIDSWWQLHNLITFHMDHSWRHQ